MRYFLTIMACMMLDIIEPVGCSRDSDAPVTEKPQTSAPAVADSPRE